MPGTRSAHQLPVKWQWSASVRPLGPKRLQQRPAGPLGSRSGTSCDVKAQSLTSSFVRAKRLPLTMRWPAIHPDDLTYRQGGSEALGIKRCEFSYLKRRRFARAKSRSPSESLWRVASLCSKSGYEVNRSLACNVTAVARQSKRERNHEPNKSIPRRIPPSNVTSVNSSMSLIPAEANRWRLSLQERRAKSSSRHRRVRPSHPAMSRTGRSNRTTTGQDHDRSSERLNRCAARIYVLSWRWLDFRRLPDA